MAASRAEPGQKPGASDSIPQPKCLDPQLLLPWAHEQGAGTEAEPSELQQAFQYEMPASQAAA